MYGIYVQCIITHSRIYYEVEVNVQLNRRRSITDMNIHLIYVFVFTNVYIYFYINSCLLFILQPPVLEASLPVDETTIPAIEEDYEV